MEKLYKVVGEDGTPALGTGKWSMPKGDKPGEWMPPIEGELRVCENGYHCCTREDLTLYLHYGLAVCELVSHGERLYRNGKVIVREARLTKRLNWDAGIARLFICDCVERALGRIEEPDSRSLKAVKVARRFAVGKASKRQLKKAHKSACVTDIAVQWGFKNYREYETAIAASWAAYEDVLAAVPRSVIWTTGLVDVDHVDAEREWQTNRLFEYLEGRA